MSVEAPIRPSGIDAAFSGRIRANTARPDDSAATRTHQHEDPHASLLRRRLAHLNTVAPLAKQFIVTAEVVHEGDSRVKLATPPTDARDPHVLETEAYGRINLRTAPPNILADLVRRGVREAEGALHQASVRHQGRHHAGENPSTAEQVTVYTQERARQGERLDRSAQQVSWLSRIMTRLGLTSEKRNAIWETLLREPSLLPLQIQVLETQATRARK